MKAKYYFICYYIEA